MLRISGNWLDTMKMKLITGSNLLKAVRLVHEHATGELILRSAVYEELVLPISSIRLNTATMDKCSTDKIDLYTESIKRGVVFPNVIVDKDNMLIDGYHRVMANSTAGSVSIKVYVPLLN